MGIENEGGLMASIKDSIEETYIDNLSILKIIIYSLPLCYSTYLYTKESTQFPIVAILTTILLFGFALKCTQNVRTGKGFVLPSFNILGTFWSGIIGIIILTPLLALSFGAVVLLMKLISNYILNENFLLYSKIILSVIFASIPLTGYILYAYKFKFTDAYNFKLISTYCIDILSELFVFCIKLFFVNLIITLPIVYLLWLFVGLTNVISFYIICILLVFYCAVSSHYMAQVDYELMEANKEN